MQLKHTHIDCPYCGHNLSIDLDYSNGDQDYYEDCSNCCNPIHLQLHIDEVNQQIQITIGTDDD